MPTPPQALYPGCPVIRRAVEVGRLTKLELRREFDRHEISLNPYGETLFAALTLSPPSSTRVVPTVQLQVGQLGLSDGATTAELFRQAAALGLEFCPLELGPLLRLHDRKQPEGAWIVIASPLPSANLPNGFYLRRLADGLWLRGYRATPDHVWLADDEFIFIEP